MCWTVDTSQEQIFARQNASHLPEPCRPDPRISNLKIGRRKRLGRALGKVAPVDPDMQAVGLSSLSPKGGVGVCCWLFPVLLLHHTGGTHLIG